jgi:hypothetical protein
MGLISRLFGGQNKVLPEIINDVKQPALSTSSFGIPVEKANKVDISNLALAIDQSLTHRSNSSEDTSSTVSSSTDLGSISSIDSSSIFLGDLVVDDLTLKDLGLPSLTMTPDVIMTEALTILGLSDNKDNEGTDIVNSLILNLVNHHRSTYDQHSLAHLDVSLFNLPVNSLNNQTIPGYDSKKLHKVSKYLRNALVNLVVRTQREIVHRSGVAHLQRSGQVISDSDGFSSIEYGKTPSQEDDKYQLGKDRDSVAHIANLAHVVSGEGNNRSIVTVRSARATSSAKIKELLIHAAIAELELSNVNELSPHVEVSQLEIVSFMDNSYTKSSLEGLKKVATNDKEMETETTFLKMMRESLVELYPAGVNTLSIPVVVTDGKGNSRSVTVEIGKPSLVNTPISGFANAGTLARARNSNKPAFKQYTKKICEKWKHEKNIIKRTIVTILINGRLSDSDKFKSIERLLKSDVVMRNNNKDLKISREELMAINALSLTMVGVTMGVSMTPLGDFIDVPAQHFNKPTDGPIERVFNRCLKKTIGVITACQCKSGQDRTGTEVALMVALDRYEKIYGGEFDPLLENPLKHQELRVLFTEAADDFCSDSNNLCRKPGEALKAGGHPFFSAMYITDLEERNRFKSSISHKLQKRSPLNIGSSAFHSNVIPSVKNEVASAFNVDPKDMARIPPTVDLFNSIYPE